MIVISDLHLGCNRRGGTTLQTAAELKKHQLSNLSTFLSKHTSEHIICNGDILDAFEIETSEVVKVFEMFADWLRLSNSSLTFIMGNHDASAKAGKLSSFHLLSHFLYSMFPDRFRMIDHKCGFTQVGDGVWVISHCLNQDLFEVELDKAVEFDGKGKRLLLHANVKNNFAEHSDHSLNLSNEALAGLMEAGWTLVVGHEHIGYTLRGGRIVVVGNQWPTSVSDCIGDEDKQAVRIQDGKLDYIETWKAEGNYAEIDWRDLTATEAKFIRVVGDATAAEAADVISAISQYRQRSDAFVITNAVKVEGVEALDEIAAEAVGSIKTFDVLGAIYEMLEDKEVETVKGLLANPQEGATCSDQSN